MKHTKNMIYRPSAESEELLLYTRNTSRIYYNHTLPVLDNLRKKLEKGVYNSEKAVDLWYYVTTAAAKMYDKEFGGMYQTTFTVTDRYTAAVEMERYYHEEMLLETA